MCGIDGENVVPALGCLQSGAGGGCSGDLAKLIVYD